MIDRKNIKVPEPLFERLKEDKGKHRSWPRYLQDQLEGTAGGETEEALSYDDVRAACAAAIREELPEVQRR